MMIINKAKAPRKSLGLYIHIPFCVRKCSYCDFLSFGSVTEADQKSYFRSLIREIQWNGKHYGNEYYVDTIFIGGGTPSLVKESLIAEMLAAVWDSFAIDGNAEISMEANPGTLDEEKLKTYRAAGVNRLSIGVQSFDEGLLQYLGRVHTKEDVLKSYALARACGFQNINLDLMFSIPGQTTDVWRDTLNQALDLSLEHISFYGLQIEEGTPFHIMRKERRLVEIEDELDRTMYHGALKILKERGYLHYEISNAAAEGYQCRHNLKYWSMEDYLGLGLGAHSFLSGVRFSNETDLGTYIKVGNQTELESEPSSSNPFAVWRHENSGEDSMAEFIFTGMRKTEGIDLTDFAGRFGQPLEAAYSDNWHKILPYIESGYLICSEDYMRFSEKGIDISNIILSEFL